MNKKKDKVIILDEKQLNKMWDKVSKKLKYNPSYTFGHSLKDYSLIKIKQNYVIYGIDNMTDEQIDLMNEVIIKAFNNVSKKNQQIVALEWQHEYNCLLEAKNFCEMIDYETYKNVENKDDYYTIVNGFYPDGDYDLWIETSFKFGYLNHPWRNEVWIFGDELIKEFEKIYTILGWNKIK